jgi:hypothetical protein
MSIKEKRKHPRAETNIEVSYVIIDDKGNEIEEGIGKIMNVSLGGIFIETTKSMGSHHILLTTRGIDDETLNMKGDVVYCKLGPLGTFRTGIEFLGHKEDIQSFVTNLLET